MPKAKTPDHSAISDDAIDKAKHDLDAQVVAARAAMGALQAEQDRRAAQRLVDRQSEGGQVLGAGTIESEESVTMGDADG